MARIMNFWIRLFNAFQVFFLRKNSFFTSYFFLPLFLLTFSSLFLDLSFSFFLFHSFTYWHACTAQNICVLSVYYYHIFVYYDLSTSFIVLYLHCTNSFDTWKSCHLSTYIYMYAYLHTYTNIYLYIYIHRIGI